MLALVAQWRGSGQTQKEFCSIHGLKVCTLAYWVRRSKEAAGSPGFRELCPGPSLSSEHIEIVYPNGVRVQTRVDLSLVAKLIHLY